MSSNNANPNNGAGSERVENQIGKAADTAPPQLRAEATTLLNQEKPAPQLESPTVVGADGTKRLDFRPQGQDQVVTAYMNGQSDSQLTQGNGKLEVKAPGATGDGTRTDKADKPQAAGSDKGDRLQDGSDRGNKAASDKAIEDMSRTLREGGMSEAEAAKVSKAIHDRLSNVKDGGGAENAETRLKGTPAEQMERMREGFETILKPGQENFSGYNERQRQNVVKDLAYKVASPDDFVNQGNKMTCALQSLEKQHLSAGDPAKVIENAASVLNKGYADLPGTNQDGSSMRVHVMKQSLTPDSESARDFNTSDHGTGKGMRGLGGQALDALYGQAHADNRSIRMGQPTSADGLDKAGNIYITAGAQNPPFNMPGSRDATGEALFTRQPDGGLKMLHNSPVIGAFDREWLNQTFGGKPGAIMVHENSVGPNNGPDARLGYPPHLDLRLNTFKSPEELQQKVAQWEKETGQPAQLMVHAAFMNGQDKLQGHALHAMTARAVEGGLLMDNQNGRSLDRVMNMRQIDIATNNRNWNTGDRPQGPAPAPGSKTDAPPAAPMVDEGPRGYRRTPSGSGSDDAYRANQPVQRHTDGKDPLQKDQKPEDLLNSPLGKDKDKDKKGAADIPMQQKLKALSDYQKALADYHEAVAKNPNAKVKPPEFKAYLPTE
ncbi:MAG TPA: hypothetical protein PLI59_09835 [Candidatus Obscuribacter sp.]|nr:hypothetical protein [Candidatus Obscuribacter sp.]